MVLYTLNPVGRDPDVQTRKMESSQDPQLTTLARGVPRDLGIHDHVSQPSTSVSPDPLQAGPLPAASGLKTSPIATKCNHLSNK